MQHISFAVSYVIILLNIKNLDRHILIGDLFFLSHSERSDTNEKRSVDSNAKREKPVVRPEEIPPVPENRFLLRRDMPLVTVEPEP